MKNLDPFPAHVLIKCRVALKSSLSTYHIHIFAFPSCLPWRGAEQRISHRSTSTQGFLQGWGTEVYKVCDYSGCLSIRC